MSDATPFDGLGRILAGGGERAVALAVSRGETAAGISLLIGKRFGELNITERDRLQEHGNAMVGAGQRAAELGDDESIGNTNPPINPYIQGAENDSGRVRWAAEVEFDEATRKVLVFGNSADYPTRSELEAMAIDAAQDIVEKYAGKFGITNTEDLNPIGVRIISIEGGF